MKTGRLCRIHDCLKEIVGSDELYSKDRKYFLSEDCLHGATVLASEGVQYWTCGDGTKLIHDPWFIDKSFVEDGWIESE